MGLSSETRRRIFLSNAALSLAVLVTGCATRAPKINETPPLSPTEIKPGEKIDLATHYFRNSSSYLVQIYEATLKHILTKAGFQLHTTPITTQVDFLPVSDLRVFNTPYQAWFITRHPQSDTISIAANWITLNSPADRFGDPLQRWALNLSSMLVASFATLALNPHPQDIPPHTPDSYLTPSFPAIDLALNYTAGLTFRQERLVAAMQPSSPPHLPTTPLLV